MFDFDVGKVWESIVAIVLAVSASLAKLLYRRDPEEMDRYRIASHLFVSAVIGIIFLKFFRSWGFDNDFIGGICGATGWMGPPALDYILEKIGMDKKKTRKTQSMNKNKLLSHKLTARTAR